MKQIRYIVYSIVVFSLIRCNKEDTPKEEGVVLYSFTDGFETPNNSLTALFPEDGSRWTNLQQVNPSNASNQASISTTTFSEGEDALRLVAFESDNVLSKMDVEKGGFKAYAGDQVTIKADFYINSTINLENLFLIDLECCSCWDPNVNEENQCPGLRLTMSGGNDYLSIERGKISASTLEQTSFQFPRNEWVTVQWELTLSDSNDSVNRLLINGNEVITDIAMNMPNPTIFKDVFAQNGIDFTLQEPVFYERIQVGATANPTAGDIELFVDNFSIRIQ